jgi:signal transduction histidine kinase
MAAHSTSFALGTGTADNGCLMRLRRAPAVDSIPRGSIFFFVLMLLATAVYVDAVDSVVAKGSVIVAIALASALAVLAGIRLNRPVRPDLWYLVAAALIVGAAGAGVWFAELGAHDVAPTPGGVQDIFFVTYYILFGGALVGVLKRSEFGNHGVLDVAIFVAAGTLLTFLVLIDPYITTTNLSALGRGVQSVSALADVCLLAIAVRLLMTLDADTPSLQLLVGAAFAWVASDVLWIWLTLIGSYTPGSSGDIGWMVSFAFCGAAALHPSMGAVSATREPRDLVIRWPLFALLAAALLAGSAVTAYGLLIGRQTNSVGTVSIASLLSLLVLARILLLLLGERRLRHEVSLRNEQLHELDRMKDGFVASVSHELRTPLTVIRGFTTTIIERWPRLSDEDKLGFMHTIDSNGKRLERLVDTVLLLSKIQAGGVVSAREPVDVAEIARDAVTELSVDVTVDIEDQAAPFVEGDPDQIYQIFINLLVNAGRYGAPPVGIEIASDDEDVTIRVCDHGDGVPPEFVPHLFDAFTQAPGGARTQGSGLGLAIVKGLVENLRGEIWYEPLRPRGACFVVKFPRLLGLPLRPQELDELADPVDRAP